MTLASSPSSSSTSSTGNSASAQKPSTSISLSPLIKAQGATPSPLLKPQTLFEDGAEQGIEAICDLSIKCTCDLPVKGGVDPPPHLKHTCDSPLKSGAESPPKKKARYDDSYPVTGPFLISGEDDQISVTVVSIMGTTFFINDLYPDDSIELLKISIFEVSGVIPENQILMLRDKILPSNISLSLKSAGITNNSILNLLISMAGGPGHFLLESTSSHGILHDEYLEQDEDEDDEDESCGLSPSPNNSPQLSTVDDIFNFSLQGVEFMSEFIEETISESTNNIHLAKLEDRSSFYYRSQSGNLFLVEVTDGFPELNLFPVTSILASERSSIFDWPVHDSPVTECIMGIPGSTSRGTSILSECISTSPSDRCFICEKRIRQSLRYPCKCTHLFCLSHKPPHLHNCSFNYHLAHKEELSEANPPIVSSKFLEFS